MPVDGQDEVSGYAGGVVCGFDGAGAGFNGFLYARVCRCRVVVVVILNWSAVPSVAVPVRR